ncbi:MAG: hypothetical protein IPJ77_01300 [Planctomycetes bacterium]|nr:hypothetical protein [Planctomycetota bacterium]
MIQHTKGPSVPEEPVSESSRYSNADWARLSRVERERLVDDWLDRREDWLLACIQRAELEIAEVQRTRGFFGITTSV